MVLICYFDKIQIFRVKKGLLLSCNKTDLSQFGYQKTKKNKSLHEILKQMFCLGLEEILTPSL